MSDAHRQVSVRREGRDGGVVAIVTLDNAARLNSMNSTLMAQLCEELATLAADTELRACVLTGAGDKAFVGGADIREMSVLRTPDGARDFISRVHACCRAVRAVPVPVIARINGFCFGAGLELAAACDLRVAAITATFGMPEVRLGIPSVVEAALLPMLVGWGRTRQMLLLGETFNADTALRWGLVERTVPMAELDGAVDAWLAALLDGRPHAIRLQKKLIGSWEDLPVRAAIQAGIDCFAAAYDTDEPVRAMRDFLVAQVERKAKG